MLYPLILQGKWGSWKSTFFIEVDGAIFYDVLHSGSRDGFTILISIFRKDVGFSELRVEISLLISSIFILQIQAEFQRIFIVSEIFSNFHNMIFKELSDYYH